VSILKSNENNIRFDLKIIASWVEHNSEVLDLGCGEGDLLVYLKKHKNVRGTGIDKKEENIFRCLEKGLSVIHGDINDEVKDYSPLSYDYIILSQTLQQVYEPSDLIRSLLEIGKKVIVSFPNFSHWKIRLQLLLTGYAPVSKQLPYEWYNTPNIRVITINDFKKYGRQIGFKIIREAAIKSNPDVKHEGKVIRLFPNMFATYGIFMIGNT
jgi:methionine biosynthesis protein MetW